MFIYICTRQPCILCTRLLMYFHPVISLSHRAWSQNLRKYFGLSNSLGFFPQGAPLLPAESCVCTVYSENGSRRSARYTYLSEWGASVSTLPDSQRRYGSMGKHAQNLKCLQRSQREWGNSEALLMVESWQRICFIYPICIKVDVAITVAGRTGGKKKIRRPICEYATNHLRCSGQGNFKTGDIKCSSKAEWWSIEEESKWFITQPSRALKSQNKYPFLAYTHVTGLGGHEIKQAPSPK